MSTESNKLSMPLQFVLVTAAMVFAHATLRLMGYGVALLNLPPGMEEVEMDWSPIFLGVGSYLTLILASVVTFSRVVHGSGRVPHDISAAFLAYVLLYFTWRMVTWWLRGYGPSQLSQNQSALLIFIGTRTAWALWLLALFALIVPRTSLVQRRLRPS